MAKKEKSMAAQKSEDITHAFREPGLTWCGIKYHRPGYAEHRVTTLGTHTCKACSKVKTKLLRGIDGGTAETA